MAKQILYVNLYHEGIEQTTRQPVSAARHLLKSGWKPVDDESAAALDVELPKPRPKRTTRSSQTAAKKPESGAATSSNEESE
jgi:hypothetical protein